MRRTLHSLIALIVLVVLELAVTKRTYRSTLAKYQFSGPLTSRVTQKDC
jgi:hypothetical protein